MATIIEQLEAAPVADALNAARTEEEWPKLAWAASRGTFGSSGIGWKPPGFSNSPPTQSRGGAYFAVGGSITGGDAYMVLDIATTYFLINGAEGAYRSFSGWLFTNGAGTGNGYQLRMRQASSGSGAPHRYIFVLSKFVEGVKTLFEETAEVTIEPGGSFALAILGGVLSMYRRETAEAEWVQVGEEHEDATFTEGFTAVDGNGSNPVLSNLRTGALEAPGGGVFVKQGGIWVPVEVGLL